MLVELRTNFVKNNPIIVKNQMLVILVNNTRADPVEGSIPCLAKRLSILISVTPNPPGIKDTAPKTIGINALN